MENKYITLTWSFIKDKSTTMQEKLILMEINNLSMLKMGCVAHNEHFASLMGIKKETVSRLINSLVEKGFITSTIKDGSRNFSRTITINKMLFDPKQNVIAPLTNCLETKENITVNKINNKEALLETAEKYLKSHIKLKSKISFTKEFKKLYFELEDRKKFLDDYIKHIEDKQEFAKRITAYLLDYEAYKTSEASWKI